MPYVKDSPWDSLWRNHLLRALVLAEPSVARKARAAVGKAPRRNTEARKQKAEDGSQKTESSPQSTGCLTADALQQRQIAASRVAKAQRHRERK